MYVCVCVLMCARASRASTHHGCPWHWLWCVVMLSPTTQRLVICCQRQRVTARSAGVGTGTGKPARAARKQVVCPQCRWAGGAHGTWQPPDTAHHHHRRQQCHQWPGVELPTTTTPNRGPTVRRRLCHVAVHPAAAGTVCACDVRGRRREGRDGHRPARPPTSPTPTATPPTPAAAHSQRRLLHEQPRAATAIRVADMVTTAPCSPHAEAAEAGGQLHVRGRTCANAVHRTKSAASGSNGHQAGEASYSVPTHFQL